MRKKEKAKNIKILESEKTPISTSTPKIYRSSYTALLSRLDRTLEEKEFGKEIAIIKKIMALGFTKQEILGAFNYYANNKGRKIESFAMFLWQKGKLINDVRHLLQVMPEKKELKLDPTQDFRTETAPKRKMTQSDFLNNITEDTNEDKKNMDKR